jgi:hypothetical protein
VSDREFENYLTLLATLLRLDRRQRYQIAEELRAHLDDRLGELVAQGVPHDEAVKRALAEFGDAAALAASFASISRGRTRRWLMRVTTFSIAATLLIAAGIFTFWPGRNAGPGAAAAVAQAPAEGTKGESPQPSLTGRNSAVSDVLNRRMDLKFDQVPLTDVMAQLTEQTGVTFYLSAKKLDEAGISPDAPLSSNFRNIRLSTGLELVLDNLELTYTVRDDVIVITTPEDAESRLEIRVYDCRDLLAMPAPVGSEKLLPFRPARQMGGMGGGLFSVEDQPQPAGQATAATPPAAGGLGGGGLIGGADYGGPRTEHDLRSENLMEIIATNIAPDAWDDVGGPGSVSEYNGLLVVTQTVQIHKQVEHVLDMLREAAGLQGPGKVVR